MTPITPRGLEINLAAARPIDAIGVARTLLRTSRVAMLATLDPSGHPYATVTNLIVEADGTPAFFAAGLAIHCRNLLADPRLSLSLADYARDVMTTPRLALSGQAEPVPADQTDALKAQYLARFPKAKLYLALPDARFFRLRTGAVQLNGGPSRNANDVQPGDLLTDLSNAGALMAAAPGLIAGLNAGDTPLRLAARIKAGAGPWRVGGIDPDGVDLIAPRGLARLWFAQPVQDPAQFQAALAG